MFIAALALAASLPMVDSIRIESGWGGLGDARATTYTITRRGDHYYGQSGAIPQDAVDRFVAAITSAPVERKTALRRLATREWLMARASETHDDVVMPVCSPEAKRLLAQHLADPTEALGALDRYFSLSWTDDYPFMAIDVTFHDRQVLHLESDAQAALMLPWKVGEAATWNPDIPRSLIELLPDGAEPRLTGRALAKDYVEKVAREMRGPIENLEERCIHQTLLTAVEKQFEIVRIYHASSGWFTAYVRRADFPSNLVLTLVIRDADKADAQEKLARTVQRARAYIDLVHDYIRSHPEKQFAIWCSDGVSVEENERAVKLYEYATGSGMVSHPRIIQPDGTVVEDGVY